MKYVIISVLVIIALAAGWYFGSPLFINKTVDEEFPFADITEKDFMEMEEAVEKLDMELPPMEEVREMTAEQKELMELDMLEKGKTMPDQVAEEELPPSEPKLLLSGDFKDADSFHKGSGEAAIYELPDGSKVLRFEDFQVTNGPDLRVILVNNPDPKSRGDVQEGYVELDRLKGNIGNQNYEIPDDLDISEYGSVVIYCKPFHVIFSTATLN